MLEFARTRIGQTFLNGHIPSLIRNLGSIAAELKRYNDVVEARGKMAARLAEAEVSNRELEERDGVTITITGPANSGKSTIARILMSALCCTTAKVTCDDPDLDSIDWSPVDWREQAMNERPVDIKVVQTARKPDAKAYSMEDVQWAWPSATMEPFSQKGRTECWIVVCPAGPWPKPGHTQQEAVDNAMAAIKRVRT